MVQGKQMLSLHTQEHKAMRVKDENSEKWLCDLGQISFTRLMLKTAN